MSWDVVLQNARVAVDSLGDAHQFKAAATQIGCDAVGPGNRRNDAEAGQFRFLVARNQSWLQAERRDLFQECLESVLEFAA